MLIALVLVTTFMLLLQGEAGLGFGKAVAQYARPYDDYETDGCEIGPLIRTPDSSMTSSNYVTAYRRLTSSDAATCNSSTATAREIHVVNVVGGGGGGDAAGSSETVRREERRPSPRVRIDIQPAVTAAGNDSSGMYEGPDLVLVLSSPFPVIWQIHSERISPTVRVHFWVLNESRIVRDIRMDMKIHRFSLRSSDSATVNTWVRRRLGSITTSIEPKLARTITRTVGQGHGCGLPSQSMRVQEMQGCVARWNEGAHGRDVHVIELHSPGGAGNDRLPVVEIFAHARKSTSRRQHFVLVLKTHDPALWKIRTKGLRGTLDIITEETVDTNAIDMNLVRVVNERLGPLTRADLVAWTADKYGPPVSYTDVQVANYIDLNVDGGDKLPRSNPRRTRIGDEVDADGGADWREAAWSAVEFIRNSLMSSQSLVCRSDSLTMSLHKKTLKSHGVTVDILSLRDPSCRPRENRTHFVWSTKLGLCGTVPRRLADKVIYENAVVVHWPRRDESSADTQAEEYSGWDENDDDTEQDYVKTIGVDFSCEYRILQNVSCDLKLYSDAGYQREIGSFPADIDDKRTVYVEASLNADKTKQVMIQNCSLVAVDASDVRHHPLIVKGCALDKTVRWFDDAGGAPGAVGENAALVTSPDAGHQSQRFEFVLQKYWPRERPMMLNCELTVCSLEASAVSPAVPLCMSKTRFCMESNIEESSSPRRHMLNIVLTRGPLTLRPARTGVHGATGSSSVSQGVPAETRQVENCNQVVIDGMETTIVIGIAFAAFFIGILLAGALWYIHSHTGSPRKPRQCGQHSLDTSGESTPCSNAPIAVHQVHRHV